MAMSESKHAQSLTPQGVPYSDLKHFVNADEQCIYSKYWEPADGVPVRALLFIAHGMGEHCQRYENMARHLTDIGILVFSHDHIGHGQSQGRRGDVKDFQFFVRDCFQHIDMMRAKHKDLPIFLLGHSMGGTIAILAACERPSLFQNTGVLLISPAIRANPELATPFKLFLGKILARVWPTAPMGNLDPDKMCRDPAVVEEYAADPLVNHASVQARLAIQTLYAMERIQNGLADMHWPFLLQHGDKDEVTELSGSRLMYEKASSTDKILTVYEGCYHELDREPDGDGARVVKEIVDWVMERLPTS